VAAAASIDSLYARRLDVRRARRANSGRQTRAAPIATASSRVDDRVHVEGDVRLQQLEREREQDNGRQEHPERSVPEGRPQRIAEADLGRDARQFGPIPDACDRDVLADEGERRNRDRHRPEPDLVHQHGADDQTDRRPADAQVDLDRLQADTLAARRGHLRQQRLVRTDDNRGEQRDGLEDEEEVDGRRRVSPVGRRCEQKHEEDRPQGGAENDVRDAATETGAGAVAEVADDDVVEGSDDAGDGEQRADREGRQKRR
jgi:hypothetical protein